MNPLWIQGINVESKPVLIKATALSLCQPLQKYAQENAGKIIKLPYSSLIVKYIEEYLNHHNGIQPPTIPCPLRSTNIHKLCFDSFDAKFINRIAENINDLYELCNICDPSLNQLDIYSLWELCCVKIASMLKGKPVETINMLYV